jgi:hypothetical protein
LFINRNFRHFRKIQLAGWTLLLVVAHTSKEFDDIEIVRMSQLQNPWVMQFNEVAKLHPRATESSATTCHFSSYVSQAGCGGTAGADVMMSFAITSG